MLLSLVGPMYFFFLYAVSRTADGHGLVSVVGKCDGGVEAHQCASKPKVEFDKCAFEKVHESCLRRVVF